MKLEQQPVSQIELTLVTEARPHRQTPVRPYQRRRQQALWWFREMHRVVDDAIGWSTQPSARQEQRRLTLVTGE